MKADAKKVLVTDDDPSIRKVLRMGLTTEGHEILEAPTGKAAIEMLSREPDLIILDLGLPDIDGMDLLHQIKVQAENIPILVLSGRQEEAKKVQALDLGADDYVTKPFEMDKLLISIRGALHRRARNEGENLIFQAGDLRVDLAAQLVKVHNHEVRLSPEEYDLLRILVVHAGKVLTQKFLLGEVSGKIADVQRLRTYIRRLREKIEDDPERPNNIMTETGVGYRLRAPD